MLAKISATPLLLCIKRNSSLQIKSKSRWFSPVLIQIHIEKIRPIGHRYGAWQRKLIMTTLPTAVVLPKFRILCVFCIKDITKG